jgi:propanediol dehydratase large subunit
MQVDLDKVLLDPQGKESTDKATVGTASYSALAAQLPEDGQMQQDQKLKQYRLIQKVADGGMTDLTAEEITMIKTRAAKALPIVWFGALSDLIDPGPQAVPIKPATPKPEAGAA